MLRFARGGPQIEDVVLDGEVTFIDVSFASDADLLVTVGGVRRPGEVFLIRGPTNMRSAPPVRVAYSEWKRLGVVRAASEQTSDLRWSTDDSSFVFSVQFDPAAALGHIVEFISVARSTLGDRGYVEFEAREVDY